MPRRSRQVLAAVVVVVLALLASAIRLVPDNLRDPLVTLATVPAGIVLAVLVVVGIFAAGRGPALRRTAALRQAHPGALVLSCYVPARFGSVLDEAHAPGEPHGPGPSNVHAAALVDRSGIRLFRGGRTVRLVRTLPASSITSVHVERLQASPVKLVPSIVLRVAAGSRPVEVALQLAEWEHTLLPRFGGPELVEHRADEVRRALGLPSDAGGSTAAP